MLLTTAFGWTTTQLPNPTQNNTLKCSSYQKHNLPNQNQCNLPISLHLPTYNPNHNPLSPTSTAKCVLQQPSALSWAHTWTGSSCWLQNIYLVWCWPNTSRNQSTVYTMWGLPTQNLKREASSNWWSSVSTWVYNPPCGICQGCPQYTSPAPRRNAFPPACNIPKGK